VGGELTLAVAAIAAIAAVAELCARVVVLLQRLLEVEHAQVVLAHGEVDAAQVVPEHAAHTLPCGRHGARVRQRSRAGWLSTGSEPLS